MPLPTGAAVAPIAYDAYQALKAGGSALAPVLEAAEATAVGAMLAETALALGAAYAGSLIGDAILKALHRPETIPFGAPLYIIGGTKNVAVSAHTIFNNGTRSDWYNVYPPNSIFPLIDYPGDVGQYRVYGVRGDTKEKLGYYQNNPPLPADWWVLDSILELDGSPATYRTTPYNPSKTEPVPVVRPTTIPLPAPYEPYPISPTVVPNPGNEPDPDNEEQVPGVIVKIPELGLQIQYRPDGVTIGRYAAPETAATDVPDAPPPKSPVKPAVAPCPCPEKPSDNKEVICRIKTLQAALLDDGYSTQTYLVNDAQAGQVVGIADEFYALELENTTQPSNQKKILYPAPAKSVEYLGYVAFLVGGVESEQHMIRFAHQSFIPPPGATGFTFSYNSGCRGSALALSRKKKPYVDLCVGL